MSNKVRITIEGSVGVGKGVVAAELVNLLRDKYGVEAVVDKHCDLEDLPAPEWLVSALQKTQWEVVEKTNNRLPSVGKIVDGG